MSSAAEITDLARTAAAALVKRYEKSTGFGRMVAYDDVASTIGATGSWLRKFIGRSNDVSVSFPIGFSILAQYERLCAGIEDDLADERRQIVALQRQINAASPIAFRTLADSSGTTPPPKKT